MGLIRRDHEAVPGCAGSPAAIGSHDPRTRESWGPRGASSSSARPSTRRGAGAEPPASDLLDDDLTAPDARDRAAAEQALRRTVEGLDAGSPGLDAVAVGPAQAQRAGLAAELRAREVQRLGVHLRLAGGDRREVALADDITGGVRIGLGREELAVGGEHLQVALQRAKHLGLDQVDAPRDLAVVAKVQTKLDAAAERDRRGGRLEAQRQAVAGGDPGRRGRLLGDRRRRGDGHRAVLGRGRRGRAGEGHEQTEAERAGHPGDATTPRRSCRELGRCAPALRGLATEFAPRRRTRHWQNMPDSHCDRTSSR